LKRTDTIVYVMRGGKRAFPFLQASKVGN